MSTDFQNPRASARGAVKAADNPMQADAFNVKMADLIVRHRRSNGGIPGISDGGMHVGKHDIKAFELGPMVAAIGMAAGMGMEIMALATTLIALAVVNTIPRILRNGEH